MIARHQPATLDDLYHVEGKAELVNGRIIPYVASGHEPSVVALEIAFHLRAYGKLTGVGVAYGDGIGFAMIPPLSSGRESFSPDASYYTGPLPQNRMRFVEGAPVLAVEVRSEGDYGEAAEQEMAAKRADYFEAGTQVVWDVDPVAATIASYTAAAPEEPLIFRHGETAHAEPALKGFQLPVAEVINRSS
jgi:Uma2 family endonuclease